MSVKASKALIGGFVVGAAVLAVGWLMLFGCGRLFQKTSRYILYFEGSVTGLNVGSHVVLKGVKVGSVVDVKIELQLSDLTCRSPVIIETLDNIALVGTEEAVREILAAVGGDREVVKREYLRRLVDRGLRAQLRLQSVVTGQLMVQLDFFPNTPVRYVGGSEMYPELPTVPSDMERLRATLEQLPIAQIVKNVDQTVKSLNDLLGSQQVKDSAVSISDLMKNLSQLSQKWNEKSESLATRLDEVLKSLHALAQELDSKVGPLSSRVEEASRSATDTLEQAKKTLAAIETTLGKDSAVVYEMRTALKALASAMDSFKALVDYLEQRPESLLRGKGTD